MSNHVVVIGHLGNDPVTRVTAKGTKVTSFSVATNSKENGEDVTIWWRITIWGDQFDYIMPYLRKGSGVIIGGKLKMPEFYDDKAGNKRITLPVTATSIDFLPKSERPPMADQAAAGGQQGYGAPAGGYASSSAYGGGHPNYAARPQQAQRPFNSMETAFASAAAPAGGGAPASAGGNARSLAHTYGAAGHSEQLEEQEDIPF